jgi:ribonuclease T2
MPQQYRGIAAIALVVVLAIGALVETFRAPSRAPPAAEQPLTPDASAPPRVENEPGAASEPPTAAQPPSEFPTQENRTTGSDRNPGGFDYYILSLSWSPTYCQDEADPQRDRRQCKAARPYAFVLHGLWPQYERGGYPENCPAQVSYVPDNIIDGILDVMPSKGLAGHQWRKHGACTRLTPESYFALARRAYERIVIPDRFRQLSQVLNTSPHEVEAAFLNANAALTPAHVTIVCRNRKLREVRICMTKDLVLRACGSGATRDCDETNISMPPVRGGL